MRKPCDEPTVALPPPWTSKLYELGCRISDRGSNIAGHPASIMLVVRQSWLMAAEDTPYPRPDHHYHSEGDHPRHW
jgi:hypothetical protein